MFQYHDAVVADYFLSKERSPNLTITSYYTRMQKQYGDSCRYFKSVCRWIKAESRRRQPTAKPTPTQVSWLNADVVTVSAVPAVMPKLVPDAKR